MKKFLSLVLIVALLVSMVSLTVSAADVNVAAGKSYTISGCGSGYVNLEGQWPSDYDANLTDGVAEEELTFGTTKNWFGFYENEDNPLNSAVDKVGTAIIDLGSKVSGINKFRVHFGNHYANGVNSPEYAKVLVSVDGTTYTEAGSFDIKDATVEENSVISYWSEVTLSTAVEARYVKLEVKLQGVFAFLNEIEVYASETGGSNNTNDGPDTYVWAKWADANDNGGAPGFQLVLGEEELSVLEDGKQYQVFANVYFSGDATGNVYFNFYAYADAAAAEAGNWDYLNSFQDFASSATAGDKLGTWATYETALVNFGIDSYGGDGSDIGCKGMTIGMGFWGATGEVRVSECGIKDADGNVIFSYEFDSIEGLKLFGGMADATAEGTSWGVVAPKSEEPTTNPGTGDTAMVFALIAIVAMAGAVVVAKKAR